MFCEQGSSLVIVYIWVVLVYGFSLMLLFVVLMIAIERLYLRAQVGSRIKIFVPTGILIIDIEKYPTYTFFQDICISGGKNWYVYRSFFCC